MRALVKKYAAKLTEHALCSPKDILIGGLDAEIVWNRDDSKQAILEEIISKLNINSILFAKPAEPYFSILNHLTKGSITKIQPQDSETRTFLHEIPVIEDFEAQAIVNALKKNKSVIVKNHGVLSFGNVSPEQAFIVFSSVLFACTVKFFSDSYYERKKGGDPAKNELFQQAMTSYENFMNSIDPTLKLANGPFQNREDALRAMIEAGKMTVKCRMVDSFFGNISYLLGDDVLISQTTSSLDELSGCIDICSLDGSTCLGLTASSEYIAHRDILTQTGNQAILHGHPKFSVIMSMICDNDNCDLKGKCHIECPEKRFVEDIPIIPGEVGAGPRGLCHTLPPAINGRRGAIVYGHGLFTLGKNDYREAFASLMDIEKLCFNRYKDLLMK